MAALIFDFDGTIADSFSVVFDLYNQIAQERGYKTVTREDWEKLRRMKIPEGLKYVGIKPYQLPGLLALGRRRLLKRADRIQVFEGIDEVIKTLISRQHKIFVLSTNARAVVLTVLKKIGLNDLVHTQNAAAVFGKASAVKQLIRRQRLDKEDVWLIGDELRDIQAAKKAKVKSIAVSWGLQPADVLTDANPTALAKTPHDLLKMEF